jgi:hypothetical protein
MPRPPLVPLVLLLAAAPPATAGGGKPVVNVSSVDALNAALDDTSGPKRIVLAPGFYALTRQLALAEGVDLVGSNEYADYEDLAGRPFPDGIPDLWKDAAHAPAPGVWANPATETILDASLAPVDGTQEVIRVGLDNEVTNLTVQNSPTALGLIGMDEAPADPTQGMRAAVRRCILRGGNVGFDTRQNHPIFANRSSVAIAEANIATDASGMWAMGFRLINNGGNGPMPNAVLQMVLVHNRVINNAFGVHGENLAAEGCALILDTSQNFFGGNGVGVSVTGGIVDGALANAAVYTSAGDVFAGNTGGGAVQGIGGDAAAGLPASNDALLSLFGTRFAGNTDVDGSPLDVIALGAWDEGDGVGPDNAVFVLACGVASDGAPGAFRAWARGAAPVGPFVGFTDGSPDLGNRVTILSSNVVFVDAAGNAVNAPRPCWGR